MNNQKKAKLEAAGWAVGSAKDFLNLSDAEVAYVETKVALGEKLRSARTLRHLSQIEVAKRLRSSQSRVAKMEAGDPSVSVDLLIRSLFRLGVSGVEVFGALSTALMASMPKSIGEPKSRRRAVVRRDSRAQHA
jgi:predicted XRE-type DNA-binding protein